MNKIDKLRELVKNGFSREVATELIIRDENNNMGYGARVDKYRDVIEKFQKGGKIGDPKNLAPVKLKHELKARPGKPQLMQKKYKIINGKKVEVDANDNPIGSKLMMKKTKK
jgi:hypothetical protein